MTAPKNVEDIYPLSPMQRLMLLHAISADGNGVLLNQVRYDLRGPLDVGRFRHAWELVVARHSALRSAFVWEGLAQPLQVVRETVRLPFRFIDLSTTDADAQTTRVEALRREDLEAPLTLAHAPLMRCTLAKIDDDRHCFIWSIHHLVVDRWSHALIFSHLRAIYQASIDDRTPQPSPPGRFREYIEWIAEQDVASAEAFWRRELAGILEPTILAVADAAPTDHRRTQTELGLSCEETTSLRRRSAAWRTTPAALLLAAVGLLHGARSGADEVLFGVAVSGRPPELEDAATIVGSFVNNLPARIRISRSQLVGEWVRELQHAQARRQSFAHVSLADIHTWSGVPAARPLFEMLVLLNLTDESDLDWSELELVPIAATLDASYRFVLSVNVEHNRITLKLVHDDSFTGVALLLDELRGFITRLAACGDDTLVDALLPAAVQKQDSSARRRQSSESVGAQRLARPMGNGKHASVDSIDVVVLEAWRDVLGIEVGPDDDFFALGGTSLQAAQLFSRVERITGTALPLSTLIRARTVRALLEAIGKPLSSNGALVRIRSSGGRAPLYVIGGVQGQVVGLSGLAEQLGSDQPIAAFESPGLDGREPPLSSIDAIAVRYVAELLPTAPSRFHVLGICWGAAVAFEMAKQLTAHGRQPASIILMDPAVLMRAPAAQPPRFAALEFAQGRLALYLDEFRKSDWRDRGLMIARKATRTMELLSGGDERAKTRTELSRERVLNANLAAIANYRPERYHGSARIFITAERDLEGRSDWRFEWASLFTPQPDVVTIGGVDTGDALSSAHVHGFARAVSAWLDAAESQRSARSSI